MTAFYLSLQLHVHIILLTCSRDNLATDCILQIIFDSLKSDSNNSIFVIHNRHLAMNTNYDLSQRVREYCKLNSATGRLEMQPYECLASQDIRFSCKASFFNNFDE